MTKQLARRMAGPLVLVLGTAVAWTVTAMVGCEAGGGTDSGGGGTTTTPAGGAGGVAGATGVGGELFDAGDQDTGLQDGDTCLKEEAVAQKVPLDVFLVVDRSGSMGSCTSGYWPPTEAALRAFFSNPLSAGLSIGLNLFPALDAGGNECVEELYNPVQIPETLPLLLLPDHLTELEGALDALHPSSCTAGTTPMYGALHGTYQAAVNYQDDNPTHKVIVVLTGDGSPCCGDCSSEWGGSEYETIPTIAAMAASAWTAGIPTYCIIIDDSASQALNSIAQQGGTQAAFDVSNDISLFAQKLDDIRAAALGCEYPIPETEEEFDPLKVNVSYTPSGGGQTQTILKVESEEACGAGAGWYYDDPEEPTMIILCPTTCNDVENDPEASISFAFGCPTEVR